MATGTSAQIVHADLLFKVLITCHFCPCGEYICTYLLNRGTFTNLTAEALELVSTEFPDCPWMPVLETACVAGPITFPFICIPKDDGSSGFSICNALKVREVVRDLMVIIYLVQMWLHLFHVRYLFKLCFECPQYLWNCRLNQTLHFSVSVFILTLNSLMKDYTSWL